MTVVGLQPVNSDITDRWSTLSIGINSVSIEVRHLLDGRENVHDEPLSGGPSVTTDDLVNAVEEKIREDRRFTISTLALEFSNVSRTTLNKVVSEKLKFRKLCARWVLRLLTEEHKLKRMACALDFWIDIIKKIDHPPYSPDLAPSDFHLFRYLKEFLGGKRFDTADEVKEEVQDWLSSQAGDVYNLGIQKFVERYDKCLNKYGKNVEK
ncbi:HTH_48 domain-containing protein [Trichonephila clavipes]|nr:HTH_48 domain-containing protein [Trichonephila clavipes]